jgi:hypothetical protein
VDSLHVRKTRQGENLPVRAKRRGDAKGCLFSMLVFKEGRRAL